MQELTLTTRRRTEMVPIGRLVKEWFAGQSCCRGVITLFVPHTTAGITINEGADPDVASDMERVLDRLVPWKADYAHAEGNTAAHVKASLLGSSIRIIASGGALQLGTWQEIYFCEFDGPRKRRVWLHMDTE